MGPMQRLVYIFEGKDELTPVARKMSAAMTKHGKEAGKGFASNLKAGLNTVGPMAASAIGVGLAFAIKAGMQVPMSQLKVTLKNAGTSFDVMKPKIEASGKAMEKLGFTGADTDKSIINLVRSTGNVNQALHAQAVVADLARVKNIGLADASLLLAKAADGNLKALKGMNITIASGKNSAAAMASAEQTLGERIDKAGGIAKFAAANHMTVAKAMDTVKAAMGGAQEATSTLGAHNLSLAQATTLVTAAQNGSSKAMKEIRAHGLGLYQAQNLVEKSTHGNIGAFNQLGIAVLPKTATSAERLAQIQKVLNSRIGGTAAAAANTFGGKLKVLHAQFTNIAEKIGLKILPVLSMFASLLIKVAGNTPMLIAFAAVVTAIAAAWIAVKIQAMIAGASMKAAMIGSGIGAAIILIVSLIYLIVTHWKLVKRIAADTWKFILMVMKAFWNWLKSNWPKILIILTGPFGLAAVFIIKHWNAIMDVAKKVINWIKTNWKAGLQFIRNVFAWLVDKILGVFGTIIHGAAKAFGWVPGLGGKLKDAAKQFDKFKKNVNDSLRGVNNKTVHVGVAFAAAQKGHQGPVFAFPKATGGAITGPGGDRSDRAGLYALSNNEYVVQASAHKKYGTRTMDALNHGKAAVFPGMASGGATKFDVKAATPTAGVIADAIKKIVGGMAGAWASSHLGNGGAIVNFAKKFLGKVPYVWGGDSTGGWDCSGFISYLYRHFNLMSGRNTAEGFRSWGKKVNSPVPGGMVTFGNPAFHIALTTGGRTTLEAGGGMHTPTWGTTAGGSGFYIPPHGFGNKGGKTSGGLWGLSELANLWTRHGARGSRYAAAIAMAESGGRANIVQSGMPPGLTGYGLWQITPTSGIWQNGRFGNLLNADNNARAAISLYRAAGSRFTPWTTFNTGAYRHWMFSHGGKIGAASFDSGYGVLRPGLNLAYNGTGRNEALSTGGGNVYNVNVKVTPLAHPADVGNAVITAIQQAEKRNGSKWRK